MAQENVGILLKADTTEIEKAKKLIKDLSDKKIQFRLDITKNNLDSVQKDIKNVESEIEKLDSKLRGIRGLTMPDAEYKAAKEHLAELRQELEKLQSKEARFQLQYDNARIQAAKSDVREYEQEVKAAEQAVQELGNTISKIGDLMQSAGSHAQSVASSIGDAFTSVGGMLTSLSNTFGGDLLSTVATTLEAMGTMTVTQGFDRSVKRYDTFKQYPKVMQALGYSAEDAAKSMESLNEAVVGTPTPLDQIAEMSKMYTLLTGDLGKGTKMAKSFNNALLASGTGAEAQATALNSLQRLVTVGDFTSKRQWIPLFTGLGASVAYVGEKFGYSRDQVQEFEKALMEGKISGQEFIDALTEAGSEGGILELTDLTKTTLSAARENLKTAFADMGTNILVSLDESLSKYDGAGLVEAIKGLSSYIREQITPMLAGVILDHSKEIVGFIDAIKRYNIKGLIEEIIKNVEKLFRVMKNIGKAIPPEVLNKFIAFATVLAGPIGAVLTKIGGAFAFISSLSFTQLGVGIALIKGLYDIVYKDTNGSWVDGISGVFNRLQKAVSDFIGKNKDTIQHIFDNFKNYDFIGLFESIAQKALNIADMWSTVITKMPTGLTAFLLTWAIPMGKGLNVFGRVLKNLSPLIGAFDKVSGGLTKAFTKLVGKESVIFKGFSKIKTLFGKGSVVEEVASIDWRGNFAKLGLMAGYTVEIGLLGGVVLEITKIAETISNAKINAGSLVKNGVAVGIVGATIAGIVTTLTGVTTALSSSGIGGGALAIGELLAGGFELLLAGMVKIFEQFAKLTETISKIKIKKGFEDNLAQITNLIDTVVGTFTGAGLLSVLTGFSDVIGGFTVRIDLANFEESVNSIKNALKSIVKIGEIDITDAQVDKVTESIKTIGRVQDKLYTALGLENPRDSKTAIGKVLAGLKNWATAWADSQISADIDSIKKALGSVATVVKSLQTIGEGADLNTDTIVDGAIKAIENAKQIETKMIEAFGIKTEQGSPTQQTSDTVTKTEIASDIAKNLEGLVTNIGKVRDVFISMQGTVAQFDDKKVDKVGEQMVKIVDKVKTVYNEVRKKFSTIGVKSGKFQAEEYYNTDLYSDVNSVTTSLANAIEDIKRIFNTMQNYSKDLGDNNIDIEKVGEKITDVVEQVGEIYKKLKGAFGKDLQGDNAGEIANNMPSSVQAMTQTLENLKGTIAKLKEIEGQVNELVPNGEFELGTKIGQIVDGINSAFSGGQATDGKAPLNEWQFGFTGAINIPNKEQLDTGVKSVIFQDTIEKLKVALTDLQAISGQIDALGDIGGKVKGVVDGLDLSFTNVDGLQAKIDTFNEAITHLNLTSLPMFSLQLDLASNAFAKFASRIQSSASQVMQSIQRVIAKCLDLRNAINNIPSSKHITISVSADGVADVIAGVRALISSLPSSKDININMNSSGLDQAILKMERLAATEDLIRSGKQVSLATGGLVHYKANGGAIQYRRGGGTLFKRRGTDTVPAMLTPGEYVMRRGAVNALGKGFFDRINALDISGAMGRLSSKLGSNVGMRSITTYNNQTYDNSNRNVVVNNYTKGTGMGTFKARRALASL